MPIPASLTDLWIRYYKGGINGMTTLNSVLGQLDSSALGYTLMHEHVIGAQAGILQNYPEFFGPNYMDSIVTRLIQAKNGGIDTIVDASTFEMGRDVSVMTEASRRSGVNIIATTGCGPDADRIVGDWSADQFTGLFIREIRNGIAGTDVKAGILKSFADVDGVTPGTEIMLRAVARAHLQTNVPIMLHSYAPGQVGRQQLHILQEEDVDMKRVKVDHSLETTDIEYLVWLLEQGCYLGMDRLPGLGVSITDRIKPLKELIDAGWAHRLLPSHDLMLVMHVPHFPPEVREWMATGNPYKLLYINKVVNPLLREMGVSETILNSMFIDNPRNFFEAT
jgi:phosphotriesterase-related protein